MDCYKPTPLFTMGGSRLQTCVILHGRWIIWDVRFCWKPRGMADPLVFSLMYVHPSLPSPRTLFFVPFRLCAILWLQSFSNRCCSILPFLEDPCVTPNEGKLVFFSVPLPSQLVRWSRLSQLLMVFCLGSYWPSKVSLQQNHIMLQMKRWLQNNLILIEFNIYNKNRTTVCPLPHPSTFCLFPLDLPSLSPGLVSSNTQWWVITRIFTRKEGFPVPVFQIRCFLLFTYAQLAVSFCPLMHFWLSGFSLGDFRKRKN